MAGTEATPDWDPERDIMVSKRGESVWHRAPSRKPTFLEKDACYEGFVLAERTRCGLTTVDRHLTLNIKDDTQRPSTPCQDCIDALP